MAGTVELIVGYVDKAAGTGAAGTSLIDQYNSDKEGFALVNQSTQTVATVAGVTSMVKLTAGFTPFLSVTTNTLAATTVFVKITAEYRTEQPFNTGDVISLVGNVAGVVGGIALLAGFGPAAALFTAVGIGANVSGIITSDVRNNLYQSLVKPVWEQYFSANPQASYSDYWVAPDLKLATLAELGAYYADRIATSHWDPATGAVSLSSDSRSVYDEGAAAGGGGGGYVEGGSSGTAPVVYPDLPDAWIDIGPIEIVNPGDVYLGSDQYHR